MLRARPAPLVAFAVAALAGTAFASVVPGVVVARTGQALPGSGGRIPSALGPPFTNTLGQVAFTGDYPDNTEFLFVNGAVVLNTADPRPDFALDNPEDTVGLSDAGAWVISPSTLAPGETGNGRDSLYSSSGIIIRSQQAAPGIPGKFIRSVGRPHLGGGGVLVFNATLADAPTGTTNARAIYRLASTPGAVPEVLIRTGQQVGPDLVGSTPQSGLALGFAASQNGQQWLASPFLAPNETATIVRNGQVYLREGDLAPGQPEGFGGTWQDFLVNSTLLLGINNAGDNVVAAQLGNLPANSSRVVAVNGRVVAMEGEPFAGVTLNGPAFPMALAIDDNGRIAMIWQHVGDDFITRRTLFITTVANPVGDAYAYLTTGDEIDTNADGLGDLTIGDLQPESLTTSGGGLDLSGGPELFLRISLPVPPVEPPPPAAQAIVRLVPTRPTTPGAGCNPADIVSIGGFPPADGELTVDDYTSFINAFAGDELLADIVAIGGFPPADGELTVDDYTSFINAFAEGC